MILLLFLLNSSLDSLKAEFEKSKDFELVVEINRLYLREGKVDSANLFINDCEKLLDRVHHPFLSFLVGENLFFAGRILEARDSYLLTASRFSSREIANDALERLYLIEVARSDTTTLKRLARTILLMVLGKTVDAQDSLEELAETRLGNYALYYLALINLNEDRPEVALKFIKKMDKDFPQNRLLRAEILRAQILMKMGNKEEARKVLEALIIKDPTSIYAVMARQLLR